LECKILEAAEKQKRPKGLKIHDMSKVSLVIHKITCPNFQIHHKNAATPPKTEMAPENGPLEKEKEHLTGETHHFCWWSLSFEKGCK